MSLGKPDLYIGGQLMQTAAADPRPALAGLRIGWGTDSRLEMDPAATLSGQLLIRGAMPSFLEVGAPVGLVDPVSSRCLFAGNLAPLRAAPDDSVRDALRVSFTAASPLAELIKHSVLDIDWGDGAPSGNRFNTLKGAMPRGWTLTGATGYDWINQGRQKYQSIEWITLAERYARSYSYRYHDTSYYTPGAGLFKRLTLSAERGKSIPAALPPAGVDGVWSSTKPAGASGVAVLPTATVGKAIEWEKSPEDMITDVQVSTFGGATVGAEDESKEFEYLMGVYVNNDAMQDAYGVRQAKIETSLSSSNVGALAERIPQIVNYWLDTETKWRPTGLQIPDSRTVDPLAMLGLLAVDTRGTAAVAVPDATDLAPGLIQSFVMAGDATWTGKKWITNLTLGRTL